jgi:sugar/nucleoside kinase (ribokinase family)
VYEPAKLMRIGVYGNLTLDELDRNGKRVVRPGGSALYSSLASAYLGARVSVVSNIGRDYPRRNLSLLRQHGIDTTRVKSFDGLTTRFRISYRGSSRKLELIHPGPQLKPRNLLQSLEAVHLGPVFLEVGLDTLNYARRHAKFLSLDVQGLLRSAGRDGLVSLVRRNIDQFLPNCNLVKATAEEACLIAPSQSLVSTARRLLRKGAQYALITRGRTGSLLVKKDGQALHIPSVPESETIDPTGAGDVFVGSWLATFLSIRDASWAAAVGAAFASLSIRKEGASKFRFARRELFRRASWVYTNSRVVKS